MTNIGMDASLSLVGTQTVAANFANFQLAASGGFVNGMQAVVDKLFDDSQIEVPVDTSFLKSTGFKEVNVVSANKSAMVVEGFVGYTGEADYAIYVHEDPEAEHKYPTKYKYLEHPFLELYSSGKAVSLFHRELVLSLLSNYGLTI